MRADPCRHVRLLRQRRRRNDDRLPINRRGYSRLFAPQLEQKRADRADVRLRRTFARGQNQSGAMVVASQLRLIMIMIAIGVMLVLPMGVAMQRALNDIQPVMMAFMRRKAVQPFSDQR